MTVTSAIAEAVAALRGRVAAATRAAGREPSAVHVIAVTKTHPPESAQAAVDAGLRDLGENRIEELMAKAPHVAGAYWHHIGRLQRRKARDVVGRQLLVHGVDRRSLVDALSRRATEAGAVQRILIQVNVGDDPAKGGCPVDDALDLVAYARDQSHLTVEGLMTVPPLAPNETAATAARPHYARLRALRDDARSRFPEVVHLSMGMSDDLEAAVAEGATLVRIGTAVFGTRGDGPWQPDLDAVHGGPAGPKEEA